MKYTIDPVPEHLRRHKTIYDRHAAGETYVSIADSLGLTPVRVRQLAQRWERQIYLHGKTWEGEEGGTG